MGNGGVEGPKGEGQVRYSDKYQDVDCPVNECSSLNLKFACLLGFVYVDCL